VKKVAEEKAQYSVDGALPREEVARLVKDLEGQMKAAAKNLEFEKAAVLRDQIIELRKRLVSEADVLHQFAESAYGSLGPRDGKRRVRPGDRWQNRIRTGRRYGK